MMHIVAILCVAIITILIAGTSSDSRIIFGNLAVSGGIIHIMIKRLRHGNRKSY